jgi:hypothetical protein
VLAGVHRSLIRLGRRWPFDSHELSERHAELVSVFENVVPTEISLDPLQLGESTKCSMRTNQEAWMNGNVMGHSDVPWASLKANDDIIGRPSGNPIPRHATELQGRRANDC